MLTTAGNFSWVNSIGARNETFHDEPADSHPSAMFGSSRKQFRKRRSCGYRFAGCLLGPVTESWSGDLKLLADLSEANVGHAIPFRNMHDGFRPDLLINLFTVIPGHKITKEPFAMRFFLSFLLYYLFLRP